jgi:hypothetical protein
MTYGLVPERKKLERPVSVHHSLSVARGLRCLQRRVMVNVQYLGRSHDRLRRVYQVDRFDDGIYLLIEAVIPLTGGLRREQKFAGRAGHTVRTFKSAMKNYLLRVVFATR